MEKTSSVSDGAPGQDHLIWNETFAFTDVWRDDERTMVVAEYDHAAGVPSLGITALVAHLTGRAPEDLPVIYDAIDPEALDALLTGSQAGLSDPSVEFTYQGYRVVVSVDKITVSERD